MTAEQPVPELADGLFFDRRAFTSREKVYGRRSWQLTTGICLHQTACHMGERPGRYDKTGAHIVITREGRVLWLHDLTDKVIHGHGWNAQTIGIEIDGLYAGVEGDPSTVWNDPSTAKRETAMELTAATVTSAHATLRWLHAEVARNDGRLAALVAHRQSTDDRRNDPGEAIWKRIALPIAAELQLTDGGPGFKIGKGRPTPEAWDESRKGIKY